MLPSYYSSSSHNHYSPSVLIGDWYQARFHPNTRMEADGVEEDGFRLYNGGRRVRVEGERVGEGKINEDEDGVKKIKEKEVKFEDKKKFCITNGFDYKNGFEFGNKSEEKKMRMKENVEDGGLYRKRVRMKENDEDGGLYRKRVHEAFPHRALENVFGGRRAQTTYTRDYSNTPLPLYIFHASLLHNNNKSRSFLPH